MDLRGKLVLLTGASSGIGEALAHELAGRGARLALASRDLPKLKKVAAHCAGRGVEARAYPLDVAKPAQAAALAKRVLRELGGIDALVNNAGVHAFSEVAELPEALARRAMEVNFFGPLRLIQAVLPGMRRQGGGLIVNIGSNLAYRSIPTGAAYSASKAALLRLTESLRDEEARHGIRVLNVAPGVVLTSLRDHALRHRVDPPAQATLPFPRSARATAREIADAMQRGPRDLISAAWPVRLWVRVLVPFFPKFLDRRMKLG
jgi:NAD(P)-dependent dehydrogenase (short-subunit alcohol dehydrogenase family)